MTFVGAAGVMGWPVAHSKSPVIHRFWLEALGLDGDYGRFAVRPEELERAVKALPALGLKGVNVTVPHKVAVMAHLDRVDEFAGHVGAVNTVVVEDGGALVGYNTDVAGVAEPLRRLGVPGGYPDHVATYAQVIGAGGAARAALMAVCRMMDLDVYNRSREKAEALAAEFGPGPKWGHGLEALGPFLAADGSDNQYISHVVINATTMGMGGENPVPIDLDAYFPDTIVFDMVYAPLETPLLRAARARGLRTIDGLEMLVCQAAAAFELFFGVAPPRERDGELRELLTR